jgi:hypothetical protein
LNLKIARKKESPKFYISGLFDWENLPGARLETLFRRKAVVIFTFEFSKQLPAPKIQAPENSLGQFPSFVNIRKTRDSKHHILYGVLEFFRLCPTSLSPSRQTHNPAPISRLHAFPLVFPARQKSRE